MSVLRAREYARQVAAEYLEPLTPAEVRVWVAARDGSPSPEAVVARWRYLNDAKYHARVFLWEQAESDTASCEERRSSHGGQPIDTRSNHRHRGET